jgi:hypothetical protein
VSCNKRLDEVGITNSVSQMDSSARIVGDDESNELVVARLVFHSFIHCCNLQLATAAGTGAANGVGG